MTGKQPGSEGSAETRPCSGWRGAGTSAQAPRWLDGVLL